MYKPVSKTKLMDLLVKSFLDICSALNAVYFEFCGVSEEDYYAQFKTVTTGNPMDLPVAWYKGKFNQVDDGSILGPGGYTCFIPDCINEVVMDHKLTPKQKLKLLNRMFGDLAKLKKAHEKGKT
jgi:hypothetical protein